MNVEYAEMMRELGIEPKAGALAPRPPTQQPMQPQVIRPPIIRPGISAAPPMQQRPQAQNPLAGITTLVAQHQQSMGATGSSSGPRPIRPPGNQFIPPPPPVQPPGNQFRPPPPLVQRPWAPALRPPGGHPAPLQPRMWAAAPAAQMAPTGPSSGSSVFSARRAHGLSSVSLPPRVHVVRGHPDVDESIMCPLHLTALAESVLYEMVRDTGARMCVDHASCEAGGQRVLIQGPQEVRERAKLHFRAWLSVQMGTDAPEGPPGGGFPPGMGFPPGFRPHAPPGMGLPPEGFPPTAFPPGAGCPPGMSTAPGFPPDAFPASGFPPGMAQAPGGFPPPNFRPSTVNAAASVSHGTVPPAFPSGGPAVVIDLEEEEVAPTGMPQDFGVTWDEL